MGTQPEYCVVKSEPLWIPCMVHVKGNTFALLKEVGPE